MISKHTVILLLTLIPSISGFAPLSKPSTSYTTKLQATENEYISSFFTGGIFDKEEDAAIKLASRIKSVKDLGWSQPSKRRGNMRPRHRAWGGEKEKAVQDKPASVLENSPESWLSQEMLETKLRCGSGPVSDTLFVALAGGTSYAEREFVEKKLQEWRPDGRNFDEASFLKSVKQGRLELATGWALFLSLSLGSASCIIFPTNPLSKGLEHALDAIIGAK